jgi:hypothetical protein
MTHQGTPIFMARAAVVCRPLVDGEYPNTVNLRSLPQLGKKAHAVYNEMLSDRLHRFPQPLAHQERYQCSREVMGDKHNWFHELRHDAESVFWLLVWWAIHVRPKNPPNRSESSLIPLPTWQDLITVDIDTKADRRKHFLATLIDGDSWLDPAYAKMNILFQQMAQQIRTDLHWVNHGTTRTDCPEEMEKPDFLHEALQRLIFDFLMENEADEFMELETHTAHRSIQLPLSRVTDTPVSHISLGTAPIGSRQEAGRKRSRNKME